MKYEITNAMYAHQNWRIKLELAIEQSEIDVPVEFIRSDLHCKFGKWLFDGSIPAEIVESEIYKKVRELHARFHEEAAKVAAVAVSGNQKNAIKLLGSDGEYDRTSRQLMELLGKWKKQF